MISAAALILICYCFFSIPFNQLVLAKVHHIQLDEVGSKNPSITNAFRNGPKTTGILLVALQALAMLFFLWLSTEVFLWPRFTAFLILLFSMLGNMYPLFNRFKGSKGRTALFWGLLYLSPLSLLLLVVVWFIAYRFMKKPNLGLYLNTVVLPLSIYIQEGQLDILAITLCASLLILINKKQRNEEFKTEGI